MIRYALSNNLLQSSFCQSFEKDQKILDFFSYGVVKHLLSLKIVQSFPVCDPSFFTSFRDACMSCREIIFDELLSSYIPSNETKSKRVCMIIAECELQKKHCNNEFNKNILFGIQTFLVNCLFTAGCNKEFNASFSLSSPDRSTQRINQIPIYNYNLPLLFA
ncbi:hypothetical protein EHI8A_226730 [Entamoeba histolytica HM-1:IMSS-B]|uniref:Uncharacterized protein n=6 Tax=Entamoeba histolytica TaxID=5759 RepID=C4MAZ8_ENTH1|nr:hypothetical protein EHI_176810 [Entamoeba histolytica HM-1:IMSS]EMD42630.1 Hypothetical protein EHI5A_096120 [Entamoeba histolytica KU27]EMH73422.1 hypothetical protein EHI8A_226730 [Entamoeba histolytica HM-1:IMSS-B]EMS11645.1 hypothetical protein KM1_111560 [Entamoeba histolytica HM-3:IMSS]ENY61449.1 hypothetical protein EHI7A_191900 [Entamoeba histolytica HM-1:IMSS-A]GAT99057.1 hypothetical protein CL6EHI_176810 [Entamoeba histolytica]|eukprot:XP_649838.1 hypothetical protein EHI_176810 [Entamoeba histolytica HM-1:IMSS]